MSKDKKPCSSCPKSVDLPSDGSVEDVIKIFKDKAQMKKMITQCMLIDHSWDAVVKEYKNVYESIV
jgi:hypothetical protein